MLQAEFFEMPVFIFILFFSGDNQQVFMPGKALGLTIACPQSPALPYKYWT
jgi:hypothetical protein